MNNNQDERKEQNFISSVVYIDEERSGCEDFFRELLKCLDEHFLHYEIIAVCNGVGEDMSRRLHGLLKQYSASPHMSLINMSVKQGREQCMNAGLDLSIGDYVYEFDSAEAVHDFGLVWKAYLEAMHGNDIVTVCPNKENIMSRTFYRTFNSHSNSAYPLRTNAFTLISRRALNRVHSVYVSPTYRKAVYSSIGLKISVLEFDGTVQNNERDKFGLAVDSLLLYTDFGYKFSLNFALLMMLATLAGLVYTVAVWLAGNPVSGWTTMMSVLTMGLTGVFAVLAIAMKYLTLIIRLFANRQNYLVESIKKI